jgi:hypothetical protein
MKTTLSLPDAGIARSSKQGFLALLAVATVGPLAVTLVNVHTDGLAHRSTSGAILILNLIAAPHVVTTLYLMLDRDQLDGVPKPALTVYVAPALLVLLTFGVLLAAPLEVVAAFMLAFVFYGMWHFGRQNVGITSFAVRVGCGRSLDRLERWTLNAGMLGGFFAAYRAFGPSLMLQPDLWPFDLSVLEPMLSRMWLVGIGLYVLLVPITICTVAVRRRGHSLLTVVTYVGSVLFFLPTYLSDNGLFLVTSWTVAHGVQYLVMLTFHAIGTGKHRSGRKVFEPFLVFGGALGAGIVLWLLTDQYARTGDATTAKLLIATTIGLTLAHYWVDQFLWRLSAPARKAWLARSFSFLGSPAAPSR